MHLLDPKYKERTTKELEGSSARFMMKSAEICITAAEGRKSCVLGTFIISTARDWNHSSEILCWKLLWVTFPTTQVLSEGEKRKKSSRLGTCAVLGGGGC